jgi:XRE family aerobic/anaerobic benzoate catabolism transcriptional regulator
LTRSGRGPLIALLGLRGSGKTSIGEQAAARLGLPFVELDARIAERAGISLAEIFELHGGAYYRRLEREELERLVKAGERGIVATGGGLVTDHAVYARLREAAVTIWLKATAEDHWNRVVAQGDARPMANRADAMKELKGLLRARRALYELADHIVDTSSLGLSRAVDRVVKLAREASSKTKAMSA